MGIAMVMGVVYAIYLLVDTQLILGGKHKNLSMDNYVLGSIIIYSDIIGLFLKILQVLGKKKDE
jgi:FtsH-binding integral membrane protein